MIASCNDNLLLSESESDVTSSSENSDSSILNSSENDSLPSESEIEESSSIEEESSSSEEESSSSEEEVILDEQLEALKSIFGEDICYYDETYAPDGNNRLIDVKRAEFAKGTDYILFDLSLLN